MLSTAPIIARGGGAASPRTARAVVLDPGDDRQVGRRAAAARRAPALIERVLPLADVVTPNLHEAAALAGMPVTTEEDMEEAARRIHALGPRPSSSRAGISKDSATDILWDGRASRASRRRALDSRPPTAPAARVVGDRRRPGARARAGGRHPRGQGLRHGRHPRRASRPAAGSASCGTSSSAGEGGMAQRRRQDAVHGAPGRAARAHHAQPRRAARRARHRVPVQPAVVDWLARPDPRSGNTLVFLAVTEAFWVQMKVALFLGLFIAAPAILWQVWRVRRAGPAHAREEVRGAVRHHRLAAVHRRRRLLAARRDAERASASCSATRGPACSR